MMLLGAIWQLDHNRWRLAIKAKQRAFREHAAPAQNVSIIKAWRSLINPLTLLDPLHFVGIPDSLLFALLKSPLQCDTPGKYISCTAAASES